MEMPHLPDYMALMESENIMTDQGISNMPTVSHVGMAGATPAPATTQQTGFEQSGGSYGAVQIGAGYYEFGGNYPNGAFNLEYVSGEGTLQLKDKDGWLTDIEFGQPGDAQSYFGLSSNEYKSFKLDGGVQLKVSCASMIQI